MTDRDYLDKVKQIKLKCDSEIHKLSQKYVEENAKFKPGQFIYNITGIIKIETIGYSMFDNMPDIKYYGYRYRKLHGKLIRTKNKKFDYLRSNVSEVKL